MDECRFYHSPNEFPHGLPRTTAGPMRNSVQRDESGFVLCEANVVMSRSQINTIITLSVLQTIYMWVVQ